MSSTSRSTAIVLAVLPEEAAFPELAASLRASLTRTGRVILVRAGGRFVADEQSFVIDVANADQWRQLLTALQRQGTTPSHVLHALSCDQERHGELALSGEEVDAELGRGLHSVITLIQAKRSILPDAAMRCVFAFTADEARPRPHHDAVGGLARALTTVDHRLELVTVQLEPSPSALAAQRLADELASPRHRNGSEVRYRSGARLTHEVHAIEPAAEAAIDTPAGDLPLRSGGVYLITGGAGGLGLLFARHLARRFGARLVLTGRSEASDNVRARLRELAALGADARYARTDVGDGEAVAALVASIQREHGALHGIFHCAGIADRTPLVTSTRADIDRVLRSKLHGTLHLDRATRALPLEVFVLFSSIAALVGDFGAGSYAAANFFLDRFAEAREEARRRGLRAGQTISVNWPLWQDGGMKMKDEDRALYFDFSGMSALDEDEGLAAFEVALRTGQPQLVVAAGDAQKIDRILQVVPSLATPATPAAATATPTTASAVLATASTSAAAPVAGGGDLRARTGAYLRQLLADATKLPVDSIQPDRALEVYGISSLLIMDLNAMLEKDFESLPRTLFFEYRSLDELAAYFVEEHRERLEVVLAPTAPAQPAPAAPPPAQPPAPLRIAPSTSAADAGIAIIGFGGRFPKAGNPDAFWDLLRNGVDAITEIPADRWDWRDYHDDTPGTPGRSYCKFGGFVDDFDRFDPLFFRLPPRTAESMDPQERLLLEVVWETVERAGYTVERLRRGRAETGSGRNRVGVFAGVMWGDYARHGHDEHHKGNPVIASADYSSIANRISYVLDLHGPSLALDTACSSSLVAVHLACESLLRGECQYAIAGGVSLSLHPAKYLQMSDLKALSAEGKCRSFGEGGKGYVPGEGAGALLLKPLRQAIADGDYIHGVLKGTAVNHDGKTNGYTVPNPGAQAEVVSAALQRANIDARTISYVEAHGTGTELGDPIEVTGLTKSYRQHTADRQYCALGSAKSNIGHLEGAAGVTGIIKVLLQLQHQQIAPSLHSQRLNPNIDFARSPFRVNQALTAWDRPRVGDREVPRRAGVSSFGAGGTNAHVIVEEFENAPRSAGGGAALIVLSAKDGDRLRAYAARLADGLRHQDADGRAEYRDLARVAHTLQTGREAMDARLAIVADDQRQLIADLEAFADGGPTAARVVTGHVKPYQLPALDDATRAAIDVACQRRDHRAIAAHWIAGHTIDWTRLYDAAPHPLVLPTYPFARDRYWIPVVPRPAPPVAALHPLVDRNVSTLEAVAFERTFRRDDAILRDHAVAGRAVLPGVAYLEMARAAGELAGPGAVTAIEDIAWIQPIVVDDQPVTVTVALRTDRQGIAYQMTSRTADRVTQHGQGRLRFEPASAPRTIALAEVIARCPRAIAADALYPLFARLGIEYGAAFRPIATLRVGDGEAIARLRLPAILGDGYRLHPSLLDGALQSIVQLGFDHDAAPQLRLPFSLGRLIVHRPLSGDCHAHAVLARDVGAGRDRVLAYRIDIAGDDGTVIAELHDYCVRVFAPGAPVGSGDRQPGEAPARRSGAPRWYRPSWEPVERSARAALPDRLLVLAAHDRSAAAPADALIAALGRHRPVHAIAPTTVLDPAWLSGSLGIIDVLDYGAGPDASPDAFLRWPLLQQLASAPIAARVLHLHGRADGSADPHSEALASLGRALASPAPRLALATLHLEPGHDGATLAQIALDELAADFGAGSELRLRGGSRSQRALRALDGEPAPAPDAVAFRRGGVYLITGGAGALGATCARHLAGRWAARIALVGSSAHGPQHQALVDELRALGGEAIYVQADLANAAAVTSLIDTVRRRFGALHGILHAAGRNEAPPFASADRASFENVFGPKARGAVHLDAATRDLDLDFIALFSSLAAVMGDFGAGAYAYASAFLDRFAAAREAQHSHGQRAGRTLSINWPLWAGDGMRLPAGQEAAYYEVAGMRALPPALGVEQLGRALAAGEPQLLLAYTDGTPRAARAIEHSNPAPITATTSPLMPPVVQPPALARPQAQTPALDNEHLTSAVDAYLKARFATVFKMTTAQLDARVRLDDYGIDSLMIVELHQLLERDLLPLPRTTFFEVPTIAALTELLVTTRADEMRRVLGLASAAASPPPSIASPTIDAPTASSITASIAAPLAAPLAGELRSLVAAHLAIPASDVDLDADLGDLGLEAVDLAHLADALDRRYGTVLPRTTLTARTSLSAIAHALEAAIATVVPDKRGPITVSAITATGITPSPGDDAHDIAIIGLGGRYPMARDLDELWANLRAGRDCVSEIPADRWDQRRYYDPEPGTPGKTYGRWGGFLDEVDRFDPLFFNIAPREAETLDPQERIFLEVAWQALEDAGYARSPIADRSVGVFVGVMYGHYQLHSAEALAAGSGAVAGGSSFASIANRVSYVLDFHGPSIAIDTMCSSSLTAIHLACNAIRTGETAMALAGGVNLSLHPLKYVLLAGGKFLASDGRCRTFGAGGTGYVPGEGAGAVVLKRLDRARADGDRVLGIIKGSALNHGGRTNGFTVPSPTAQAEVIARAVADADIDPSTLSYVEAHGTGTSLGDPIEIAGLARAVGRGRREPCAIGSIKSNLGHLESAAAIAGLTKILLQGAHGELVPSLHAEPANPSIDFAATPFRVQQSTSPWRSVDDRGQPRPLRAGLSSFGAGGSNGHLVVEIEPARPRGARSTTPQILVLSAKNAERLRACAGRLRDHLRATEDDLADIAHSLQISREAMDARLAIVTSTVEDAIAKLTRFLAGAVDAELHEGNARAGHARQLVHGRAGGLFVQALVEDGDLARVASLWVNGCEIEWHRLAPVCWPNGDRRRVALPTYPFARERCWFTAPDTRPATGSLHPLIGRNTSTFDEQRFTTTWGGDEPFLADHRISGRVLVPGTAYLEMARVAGELATGATVTGLSDITWVRPLEVDGAVEVTIHLEPADGGGEFRVTSDGGAVIHARGRLHVDAPAPVAPLDLAAIRTRCTPRGDRDEHYRFLRDHGFEYGPAFQAIEAFHDGDCEALVRLSLSDAHHRAFPPGLHPTLLDAAIHAGVLHLRREAAAMDCPPVPFYLRELAIHAPLPARCHAHLTVERRDNGDLVTSIALVDDDGNALVEIAGFTGRPLDGSVDPQAERQGPASSARPVDGDKPAVETFTHGWQPSSLGAPSAAPRTIRLIASDSAGARAFERLAAERGAEITRLRPGAPVSDVRTADAVVVLADDSLAVAPGRVDALEALFPVASDLAQSGASLRVVIASHGAAPALDVAASAGVCRSLARVAPGVRAQILHATRRAPEALAAALWTELTHAAVATVTELRLDGDDRQRWVAMPTALIAAANGHSRPLRASGTYLVTGGASGLGALVALHLAARCRAHLVLTGRSPRDAAREALLARIRNAGGDAIYVQADVADEAAMAAVVEVATTRFGAIHGVVHAAGVADNRGFADKSWPELRANLRPKIDGTLVLDRITADQPLDFFAIFSSTSALLGDFGAGDYAAGNRYQVAFGEHREGLRAEGRRRGATLIVQWPLWREGGIGGRGAATATAEAAYLARSGQSYLESDAGLAVLDRILAARQSPVTVLCGAPTHLRRLVDVGTAPIAAARVPVPVQVPTPARTPASAIAPHAAVAPNAAVAGSLRALLVEAIAEVVRMKPSAIELDANLAEYGFDSVSVARLTDEVNRRLGLTLPPILFFEHTTVRAIEDHLSAAHGAAIAARLGRHRPATTTALTIASPAPSTRSAPSRATSRFARTATPAPVTSDVAIIGVAGRYPQADDLAAFWQLLQGGQSAISEVPADRWTPRTDRRWGGFLDGIDQFDAAFFRLSPKQARLMDPMQRLFLECAHHTFEDAGYSRAALARTGAVGVYVGAMYHHYALLAADEATRSYLLATCGASIANHVAHHFDLHGPCLAVDTACASSLTAIHLACESLRAGTTRMALAGGVNLSLIAEKYIGLEDLQLLGSTAESRPFGAGDGMIAGEGVGAVLLKPLADAIRDGDPIRAIIKASAASHGGTRTGLAAPNLAAQADLFAAALDQAGIEARTISYVEAAANGSALGDPVEVRALTRAFARTTTDRGYCALGTVKSNIGHLEAASGVSQLTKVLLQLERGTLVPTINTEPRNPSLALDDTPFYLQRDVAPWPRPVLDGREAPRRALINSFGAGGGYATLLVEEYQPPPRRAAPAPLFHIIPLSARTRGSLQRLAARVHGAIAHMDELRLDDLAWTLQTGRDAMEHRLAIVATRRESLLAALAAYVAGPDTAIPGLLAGHVDDQQATAPRSGEPSALAEAWVHGAVIDWAALRTDDARRVSLPGYPFEHRSYWIETAVVAPVATTAIAPTATASSAPARSAPACSAPRHLAGLLCDRFAVALGLEPGELAATDSLHRLGLDSITTAKLRVSLEAELGMTIPMELISGIRTVGELATQLADRGAHISPAAIEGRDAVNVVDLPDLADLDDGELVRLYAHLHDSK